MNYLSLFHTVLAEGSNWIWPRVMSHLVESSIFVLCPLIAAAFLKRAPDRARYCVWLMALAKFAIPSALLLGLAIRMGADFSRFSATARSFAISNPIRLAGPTLMSNSLNDLVVQSKINESGIPAPHRETYCALSLAWVTGFLAVVAVWRQARRRFRSAVLSGRETGYGREADALANAQLRMGSRRDIRLMISSQVHSPAVCGVLKPVIVLPEGLGANLSDAGLESVLLHELVHVRYWDNLWSDLQMLLCSVFWFYPLVWLLDRKLIAERERACDRSVTMLTSPETYAQSVLTVCRLCISENLAGISRAAGANVRQRVKDILAPQRRGAFSVLHRVVVGSTLIWLFVFSICFGALNNTDVRAQTLAITPTPGADSERDPAQAPKASATVSPRAIGDPGLTVEQEHDVARAINSAPETVIRSENLAGAPVHVSRATLKIVPVGGEWLITPPVLSMANNADKRITSVRVGLRAAESFSDSSEFRVDIAPHQTFVLRPDWRRWWNKVKSIRSEELVAEVTGVVFGDDSAWGDVSGLMNPWASPSASLRPVAQDPVLAGSPSTSLAGEQDGTRSIPAKFLNPEGAPLTIYRAETRADAPRSQETDGLLLSSGKASYLPVVTLTNETDQRIVAVKLRFKADADSHAVAARRISIEPHASYIFESNATIAGSPEEMHVQVLGVEFADGAVWGAMDSEVHSRDLWVDVPLAIKRPQH